EHRMLPLLGVQAGELGRRRRLAGALQADQHPDGRWVRRRREPGAAAAKQPPQLVVPDLYHLPGRRERPWDVPTDGLDLYAVDEAADDLEVDVGFQEGHADFPQRGLDVVFGEPALAAQAVEDRSQSCAQRVEHGKSESTELRGTFQLPGLHDSAAA